MVDKIIKTEPIIIFTVNFSSYRKTETITVVVGSNIFNIEAKEEPNFLTPYNKSPKENIVHKSDIAAKL